jgi:NADH dehydrogenase/NADH:ubiquinone oxidoreductase subunit G
MGVELIIDGVQVTAAAGASVLDAARGAGCDVPGLCHHTAVPAIASCRLCLVEIGRPGRDHVHLTTSCDYPVSAGLVVVTDSARIRRHRAMNLQLLLRRAPDAPVLRSLAADLGVATPRFAPLADASLPDCILCELCVRVCSALGYNALAAIGRGETKRVGPPFGQSTAKACVGCGSCVEACPTDCIAMEETPTTRTIWGRTLEFSTCERCGARLMTTSQRAATAARGDLPARYYNLCEVCKRAALSQGLAADGPTAATGFESREHR